MAAPNITTTPTRSTAEQRAIVEIIKHIKVHHQTLQNIERRDAEASKHLAKLEALQAETRLLRMDLNNYVTDDEFAAMHDRVSALEKTSETPKQRDERMTHQRLAILWSACCVVGSALMIVGFLAALSGRIGALEDAYRQITQTQIYPGNPR